jgi:pilus assembly protein CpaC
VRPEVSEIDTTVSVTTGGITVPGLSVRRADTTVELGSGQSFAIAGLLQSNTNDLISQVPGDGFDSDPRQAVLLDELPEQQD